MSEDTIFLLQAFVIGAAIPFIYDGARIFRRVIPHKQILVSLEDMLFWLVCAFYVFWWMYRASNGGMRWFAVAGALFGMYLYKRLVSGWFVTYVSHLLQYLLHILGRILAIVLRPIAFIGKKVKFARKKVHGRVKKLTGNLKLRLKSCLRAIKIRLCKQ